MRVHTLSKAMTIRGVFIFMLILLKIYFIDATTNTTTEDPWKLRSSQEDIWFPIENSFLTSPTRVQLISPPRGPQRMIVAHQGKYLVYQLGCRFGKSCEWEKIAETQPASKFELLAASLSPSGEHVVRIMSSVSPNPSPTTSATTTTTLLLQVVPVGRYYNAQSIVYTSVLDFPCPTETSLPRLVWKGSFLLLTCPSWDQYRGRARLYFVHANATEMNLEIATDILGDVSGDGLGAAADMVATTTTHLAVVQPPQQQQLLRLVIAAPGSQSACGSGGQVANTGRVVVYDVTMIPSQQQQPLQSQSMIRAEYAIHPVHDAIVGSNCDTGLGISLSLSYEWNVTSTLAIGTKQGSLWIVSRDEGSTSPSAVWNFVQEIHPANLARNVSASQNDLANESALSPQRIREVFFSVDHRRLVFASSTTRSEVGGSFDQVMVFDRFIESESNRSRWNCSMNTQYSSSISNPTGRFLALYSTGYAVALLFIHSNHPDSVASNANATTTTSRRWGNVRVMVDTRPFCSVSNPFTGSEPFFMERYDQCSHTKKGTVSNQTFCESIVITGTDGDSEGKSCAWYTYNHSSSTSMQTPAPSSAPSRQPAISPIPLSSTLSACMCDGSTSQCIPNRCSLSIGQDWVVCVRETRDQTILFRNVSSFYLLQGGAQMVLVDDRGLVQVDGVRYTCSSTLCQVVIPRVCTELLFKGKADIVVAGTIVYTKAQNATEGELRRRLRSNGNETSLLPQFLVSHSSFHQAYFAMAIPIPANCNVLLDQQKQKRIHVALSALTVTIMVALLVLAVLCFRVMHFNSHRNQGTLSEGNDIVSYDYAISKRSRSWGSI